jgi:site-specific recombinase XerD
MPWENIMRGNITLLGYWIRRFLLEHLIGERNLARNTQLGYRDALALLVPFASRKLNMSADTLNVTDLSADLIRMFLTNLETSRKCSIQTRNQRLAAIHAFARFVGEHSLEHIAWCAQIRLVPFKRTTRAAVGYLDKSEMDALLAAPDGQTDQGRRDYTLMLFLYNSGARADEAAQLLIKDVDLWRSSVNILGKGRKPRCCPLWPSTIQALNSLIGERTPNERVFLNRRRQPITRFGIHALVARYALKARTQAPSIAKKRVSPHTLRHSTACHLLRAGVDINTIRGWLGHVSLDTTNIYAEIDLEMKASALAKCDIGTKGQKIPRWHQPEIMEFLKNLA